VDIEAIRKRWESGEAQLAGCMIYDAVPMAMRPGWAADILELACARWPAVPTQVRAVIEIGRDPKRWREAHAAFSAVRKLTLVEDQSHAGGDIYLAVLVTAENAAKVIYNASGESAPFDFECGYWLVGCLGHLVLLCGSPECKRQG